MQNEGLLSKLSFLISVCILGGLLLGIITEKSWFSAPAKKSVEVPLEEMGKESFLNADTSEVWAWPKSESTELEDSLTTKEEEKCIE